MKRQTKLGKMLVKDVRNLVVRDPAVIGPDASVEELLRVMIADTRTRHVYVIDEGRKLIGSVRMNAVVEFLFPFAAIIERGTELVVGDVVNLNVRTVRDIMNPDPAFVHEDTPLEEMARILMRERINELPVIDEERRVIGQVNMYEVILGYLRDRGVE